MSSGKSILKSTLAIVNSKIWIFFLQLIRSKTIAVILGPTGTGLLSAYQAILSLVTTVSGIGVDTAAVREIAEYNNKHNARVNTIIKIVRYVILATGIMGMILTLLFAENISIITFGSAKYKFEVGLLSIAILFNILYNNNYSVLQGLRKIRALSKMTVYSTLAGTIISLPIIWFYQLEGIVWYIIILTFGKLVVSIYYRNKAHNSQRGDLNIENVPQIIFSLISQGSTFMLSGIGNRGGSYLIRLSIISTLGLASVGIYQASYTLSTFLLSLILDGLGKDFYPRISGLSGDIEKENSAINAQTEIGIFLTLPMVIITIGFAPILISTFYSDDFLEGQRLIRWLSIAIFLRTLSWPLSYTVISKRKNRLYLIIEILSSAILVIGVHYFVAYIGLEGAGLGYLVMYTLYAIIMAIIINYYNGYTWSFDIIKMLLGALVLVSVQISSMTIIEGLWSSILSLLLSGLFIYAFKDRFLFYTGFISLKELVVNLLKRRGKNVK